MQYDMYLMRMVVVNMNRNLESFLFKRDYNGDIVIRPMTHLPARARSNKFPYVHGPEWRGADQRRLGRRNVDQAHFVISNTQRTFGH